MGRRKGKKKVVENLRIETAAAQGHCMGRTESGMVVFVPYTAPGDVVDAVIIKKKKRFGHGKVLRFHEKSELRTEPFCSHFGQCGGCRWQHMPYELQLELKAQTVKDSLERIGGLSFPEPEQILPCDTPRYYRNKMEFSFSDFRWLTREEIESGEELSRNALGFHVPGHFDRVIDIEHCFLQADPSNAIRLFVRKRAEELGIPFYNSKFHTGQIRSLILRCTSAGDWMAILQTAEASEEFMQLLEEVRDKFSEIKALLYVVNSKKNETFYDLEVKRFHGDEFITEEMEGLKFRIGPKSFYQTNSAQAYELYKATRKLAGLTGSELVYDLYTGTGTIANFIAKDAGRVIGIESVAEAIEDAKLNSRENGIENTEFFAGDMRDLLTNEFIAEKGQPDVIVTDPPRAGMHPSVVETILKCRAPKVVYVSCNPGTQSRDLAVLDEAYKIQTVQPVDMFPQTHHVENIVLLELR